MVDILLTNDDGHRSAGFVPLLKVVSEKYDVLAITPSSEQSWIGKAVTSREELVVKTVKKYGMDIHTVSGTPADCVQVGLYHFAEVRPKLILAGINLGSNASVARILSSGTVGAGMEGAIAGVRSVCVSLNIPKTIAAKTDLFSPKAYPMFAPAVDITLKLVDMIIDEAFGPGFEILSVMIPLDATVDSEIEVTHPDTISYGQLFARSGVGFKHYEQTKDQNKISKGSDLDALARGNVSVTPISLKLTTEEGLLSARKLIGEN